MIKKIIFLLLSYQSINAMLDNHIIDTTSRKLPYLQQIHERKIMMDMSYFLKEGRAPEQEMYSWFDEKKEILKQSETAEIRAIGDTVERIINRKIWFWQAPAAVRTFITGIKVYDPNFSLGTTEISHALTAGTGWWRSSGKKPNN